MIYTVTGEIKKEEVGFALPHEHVLCDLRPSLVDNVETEYLNQKLSLKNRHAIYSDPYVIADNVCYLDEEIAIDELKFYKKQGGDTIFDCTTFFRDHEALKRISVKSGVNIAVGCGSYVDLYLTDEVKNASARTLADSMIKELTVGIDGSDIKAGFIGEIGTSKFITDNEWKNVQAAGIASIETGSAIHFHTSLWEENGLEIVDKLITMGVKPEKICIDHIDVCLRQDYLLKLLDKGAYIEYDNFGKEFFIPKRETGVLKGRFAYDYERCQSIEKLVKAGFTDKILITTDICIKSMLYNYGGNGFAHLPANITTMLKDVGLSEKDVNKLTRENPANFFDR